METNKLDIFGFVFTMIGLLNLRAHFVADTGRTSDQADQSRTLSPLNASVRAGAGRHHTPQGNNRTPNRHAGQQQPSGLARGQPSIGLAAHSAALPSDMVSAAIEKVMEE